MYLKDVDFVGRSALNRKRGQWRRNKLTMLKVEDDEEREMEGNESIWLQGKVGVN